MGTSLKADRGADIFGSVCVAMVTPFDSDGEVDLRAGRDLAAHLVENGIDALVLAGTTGESPTTTDEEKVALLKAVREEIGDKARIIAGAGSNNTRHAVAMAQAAQEAGADGLLVVTPYYSKPSQAGVEAHFRAVAEATDLPICLYDIPGRSGVPIESATIRALAQVDNIKAMKDAKGNFLEAATLIQETGLAWYSGDDPLNLPWLSIGATGMISVVGHAAPQALRELVTAFENGDLTRAREINANTLNALARQQSALGGVAFAKAALRLQGIDVGDPRPPVAAATEQQVERLRDDMTQAGVL
ncbi:4-hydroxy-tetrahydrodipicolinate synthase [Corynebacterium ureicelerivorans]|uniref:4-hydroxy-tetrahydrodipicolinate synthase n=1 Tax=Corynebacterium ureicelerivorans TaxID=401472 RepID=UPI00264EB35D|nr:4-hydroxy-tetrahydrodipicolinate synthase [Corynebacterium ureicelerivorans]MDN8604905.1 4-hydroxy-tetrahydrodipicolinate synthase [Corynebacterium ureicelerivorans]